MCSSNSQKLCRVRGLHYNSLPLHQRVCQLGVVVPERINDDVISGHFLGRGTPEGSMCIVEIKRKPLQLHRFDRRRAI
jgi:hypothetical protein